MDVLIFGDLLVWTSSAPEIRTPQKRDRNLAPSGCTSPASEIFTPAKNRVEPFWTSPICSKLKGRLSLSCKDADFGSWLRYAGGLYGCVLCGLSFPANVPLYNLRRHQSTATHAAKVAKMFGSGSDQHGETHGAPSTANFRALLNDRRKGVAMITKTR